MRAVADAGYTAPTPIQTQAIPALLRGTDVLGCAQTGTGKTAAFALPVLQRLTAQPLPAGPRPIRALILSPTRELAAQIGESFVTYGRHLPVRSLVIFGGVNENPQIRALQGPIDVLVATPGRLLDLLDRGFVRLDAVEYFVLDEADRMLDMGFIRDIRRVLRVLPARRQNLLFSATMPKEIAELASSFLHNPVRVEVTPPASTVDRIEQRVLFVSKGDKRRLLAELLMAPNVERSIVFTRTKHGANKLVEVLERDGISAAAIHGNKSQSARERALEGFKRGTIPVLVATDIASRGLDVDDVSHVFNFELPNEPDSYVHRIGRTARAGRDGAAISLVEPEETAYLVDIQRLIGRAIPCDDTHPYHCPAAMPRSASPRGTPAPRGVLGAPRTDLPPVTDDRPPRPVHQQRGGQPRPPAQHQRPGAPPSRGSAPGGSQPRTASQPRPASPPQQPARTAAPSNQGASSQGASNQRGPELWPEAPGRGGDHRNGDPRAAAPQGNTNAAGGAPKKRRRRRGGGSKPTASAE